jgi:serine/threonine protein kinase/Tfp pilus assembly protein PilF
MKAQAGRGPATTADGGSAVLDDLVDDLIARLQAGEHVDPEDYAGRFPEHAERLRRLWPTLAVLAELGRSAAAGSSAGPAAIDPGEAPAVLGDYRVVREVGRGGMGVVYEAEQLSLGRRVALKVLPFAAALDPRQRARFQLEAHAAACLHHPHIVPIHTVGCERGAHFYAMQYIDGPSLADLIRDRIRAETPTGSWDGRDLGPVDAAEGPPPSAPSAVPRDRERLREVARLGVQAAGALQHAHEQGILHRDIKPSNLLVDGRRHLWVTDFGLARFKDDPGLTMTGTLVGTLRYMSPEQAGGRRSIVDHRTDIYSLGATLYELLTLRPVFPGRDRQELLRQIAESEPLAPRRIDPAIPRDLETIVLKAMAKDPAGRYATAQDFADDLGRFLADQPIRARRPSPFGRVAKWSRRHRAAVVTAAIVLVATTAVGGLMLWREQRHTLDALKQAKEERGRSEAFLLNLFALADDLSIEAMGRVANARRGQSEKDDFYRRAKDFYGTVVEQTRSYPEMRAITAEALRRVGFCRMLLKDAGAEASYRSAIELFEPLAIERPRDFRLRANLAGTYGDLAVLHQYTMDPTRPKDPKSAEGPRRRALAEWRRVASDFPDDESVLRTVAGESALLASNLAAQGRRDEAARAVGEAIDFLVGLLRRPPANPGRGPRVVRAFQELGVGLSHAGLRREAVRALERGLELAPNDGALNNNLAWLLVEYPGAPPHDPSRAVALARRAIENAPSMAVFWNTLGVALYRVGDCEGAAEALNKSMELNTVDREGDPNDWLFLAMLEHRRGDRRKARAWLDRSVAWIEARKSDDAAILRARAEAEQLLGPADAPEAAPSPGCSSQERVGHPERVEGGQPERARVAAQAGAAVGAGVVAGVRQGVVHAQGQAAGDDAVLGHRQERGVDPEGAAALDAGLRRQVGHHLEGAEVLGPAVGIAGVVHAVGAEEEVEGAERFGPGQGQRQEHRVPRRHVGDGDLGRHRLGGAVLGDVDVGRQGAAAEGAEVDLELDVPRDSHRRRHPPRRQALDLVPLAVADRQRIRLEAGGDRLGQDRRRVEPAAEQDHPLRPIDHSPPSPQSRRRSPGRTHCRPDIGRRQGRPGR